MSRPSSGRLAQCVHIALVKPARGPSSAGGLHEPSGLMQVFGRGGLHFQRLADRSGDVEPHNRRALACEAENPFPWMSEAMDLKKEKNFFETRVIEYQNGGALAWD